MYVFERVVCLLVLLARFRVLDGVHLMMEHGDGDALVQLESLSKRKLDMWQDGGALRKRSDAGIERS